MSAEKPAPEDNGALFRPEAIRAATDRMGRPADMLNLANWVLTLLLAAILSAAIVLLAVGRYARKEVVEGTLQPSTGALRVISLRNGVIASVEVREGEAVQRGDSILTLATDVHLERSRKLSDTLQGSIAEQRMAAETQKSAKIKLIEAQMNALRAKREGFSVQIEHTKMELELQQKRVDLVQKTVDASRILLERELLSAVQFRQREEMLIAAQQNLSSIEKSIAQFPSSMREFAAEENELIAQRESLIADTLSASASLDEKEASVSAETQNVIVSPKAGKVVALQARPGAPVAAGQTLAIVIPHGVSLVAELWVPSRAIGFLRTGRKTRLMYDAFPYQRFGVGVGRVREIAAAPTAPSDLPVPIKTQESLYRVVVELDRQHVSGYGADWPLAPGMHVSADLVLEEQSLLDWLFDKIRAAKIRSQVI